MESISTHTTTITRSACKLATAKPKVGKPKTGKAAKVVGAATQLATLIAKFATKDFDMTLVLDTIRLVIVIGMVALEFATDVAPALKYAGPILLLVLDIKAVYERGCVLWNCDRSSKHYTSVFALFLLECVGFLADATMIVPAPHVPVAMALSAGVKIVVLVIENWDTIKSGVEWMNEDPTNWAVLASIIPAAAGLATAYHLSAAAAEIGTVGYEVGTAAAEIGTAGAEVGTAAAEVGTAGAEVGAAAAEVTFGTTATVLGVVGGALGVVAGGFQIGLGINSLLEGHITASGVADLIKLVMDRSVGLKNIDCDCLPYAVKEAYQKLLGSLQHLSSILVELQQDITYHNEAANGSKIGAGVASFAGSVCLICAPFTGGISVLVGGIITVSVGAVTTIGATAADFMWKTPEFQTKIKKIAEDYNAANEEFQCALEHVDFKDAGSSNRYAIAVV